MENKAGAKLVGKFDIECYRDGKLLWEDFSHNIIPNESLNRILNTMVAGTTQIATWYAGLVESNTVATATMTYDVPIFTESTAYDEATRPAYVEVPSTAQSITNAASKATFTINDTKTMYGAALFSATTKGSHDAGADNVLFCYAQFATSRAVLDNDVINLTYTVTAADDGA